jgi:chemotaxis protein MotB
MAANGKIIIIKKNGGHAGHHGGAWKVAYADFVTAMMALFIVLWLMNTSKQVQEAVGGYFKDPRGTSKFVGHGTSKIMDSGQGGAGANPMGGGAGKNLIAGAAGENMVVGKDDMNRLKEELQNSIHKIKEFNSLNKQIEMTVTSEGLRIELLESATGTFFDIGNATPSQNGTELLKALAAEIGKLPNQVSIEGHTDSKPYGKAGYSNWELSVDRANAARRIMSQSGMSPTQVSQVRGYADQRLRQKDHPEDPSNRRISVIVAYIDPPSGNEETPGPPAHSPEPKGPAAQTH